MTTLELETVQLQIEDRIARITLNRPERLNALSAQLTQDLGDAVERVATTDEDVRCVVLTGAGQFVEVQATAEGRTFSQEQLDELLKLSKAGIEQLKIVQKDALGAAWPW